MPPTDDLQPVSPLTEEAAEARISGTCFKTGPPGQVGVELEWLLNDVHDPTLPVPTTRLDGALCPDLVRGALSTEPGGQLELSSRPHPTLAACLAETAADMAELRAATGSRGVQLTGLGVDPLRPPVRLVSSPRYDAMEQFFDRAGPHGRVMMCSTAAVQVCVEAATATDSYQDRWQALHALGPVLVAAFANSPLRQGRPTGWRSTRQAVWARLDTSHAGLPWDATDPRETWTRQVLDAPVLMITDGPGRCQSPPPGLTFRGWLRGAGPARQPTLADLDYHLTTLFPPVRARGWLELRVIDAQPADGWAVVATVVVALLDDLVARDTALAAAEPVRSRWLSAARDGLTEPQLARAVRDCFAAALDGASRLGLPVDARAALATFIERYVERARCPADDALDAWYSGADPIDEESVPC